MAAFSTPTSYRVGDLSVDVTRRILRRADGEEVHLKPRVFAVLLHLLENRGRLVTRQELLDSVWQEMPASDEALTQCITDLRRALLDSPRNPHYLETVPRTGFRFLADVEEVGFARPVVSEISGGVAGRAWGEGFVPKVRRHRLIAASSVALLAVAGITFLALRSYSLPEPPPASAGKRRVMAVLQFENRTGESDLDWLGDGIAEMLSTTLSRSRTLEVLNREQVRTRKDWGQARGVLEAARRSRADVAITGIFERHGRGIRVQSRAYDGRNGELLTTESIMAARPEDLPRQVNVLGARLSRRLGPKTSGETLDAHLPATGNLEAYRYYVLGLRESDATHNTEAIALFRRALALDPGLVMAYAHLGYAYAVNSAEPARGRPYLEKAIQMSGQLSEKDRREVAAWYAIANEDDPEAIRRYRELIAADPNDVEAYYRLAVLMRGQSRQEEAIDLLQQALAIDADDPDLYRSMSANLSQLGRHAEAIRMAERYVALAPTDADAFDSLAQAFRIAGRYDEAEWALSRALHVQPDFQLAAIHRGALYMETGRLREGMAELRRWAVSADSAAFRSRCWLTLAWWSWRRGQWAEAKAGVRNAQRETPGQVFWSPAALLLPTQGSAPTLDVAPVPGGSRDGRRTQYFYLAQKARMKGRRTDMLADLREALSYRMELADFEPLEDALADGYLEAGRLDDAIAEYERALKVAPGMAMAHYHLAHAYLKKARRDAAKAEFQRFLAICSHADGDLPEVAEARRRVR